MRAALLELIAGPRLSTLIRHFGPVTRVAAIPTTYPYVRA
jgi:hypothetical protein